MFKIYTLAPIILIIFFLLWIWGTHIYRLAGNQNHKKLHGKQVNLQFYKRKYQGQATTLHEAIINLDMYIPRHDMRKCIPVSRASFENEEKFILSVSYLIQSQITWKSHRVRIILKNVTWYPVCYISLLWARLKTSFCNDTPGHWREAHQPKTRFPFQSKKSIKF